MSIKVYSAARAFFPLHGKSKEEAWKELTGMFDPKAEDAKSYIPLGRPLNCVIRHRSDHISLRDIFKYGTSSGRAHYVEIVECTPYKSFAYDDEWKPMNGEEMEEADEYRSKTRMEFFLKTHPEATLVEIRRRVKGRTQFFRDFIESFSSCSPAQTAAYDLSFMLTGTYRQEAEIKIGELYIKRDDSYRIDF